MIKEYYNNIATYLTETFSNNSIVLIILSTTVMSIVYFIIISYIITQMDKRYFLREKKAGEKNNAFDSTKNSDLESTNSGQTNVLKIAKIVVGVCLLLCGVVMLVLPGQGLITILLGLSLIPFPGKNKLEQKLLARKSVRSSLNWIRTKANKEPFIFD